MTPKQISNSLPADNLNPFLFGTFTSFFSPKYYDVGDIDDTDDNDTLDYVDLDDSVT